MPYFDRWLPLAAVSVCVCVLWESTRLRNASAETKRCEFVEGAGIRDGMRRSLALPRIARLRGGSVTSDPCLYVWTVC